MDTASKITLLFCGAFFLTGLLTGVWKYLSIRKSPIAKAPRYVTIAHRASLQYSFAALILLKLLEFSPYTETVNLLAVSLPLFFFSAAILAYLFHATLQDTDNQFRKPYQFGKTQIKPFLLHAFVWLLIFGEILGFAVLFIGALRTISESL